MVDNFIETNWLQSSTVLRTSPPYYLHYPSVFIQIVTALNVDSILSKYWCQWFYDQQEKNY